MGGCLKQVPPPVDLPGDHGRQAHDGSQDGGLAGPVGAHHRHDLAPLDSQGCLVQSYYPAVMDRYVDQLEKSHRQGG